MALEVADCSHLIIQLFQSKYTEDFAKTRDVVLFNVNFDRILKFPAQMINSVHRKQVTEEKARLRKADRTERDQNRSDRVELWRLIGRFRAGNAGDGLAMSLNVVDFHWA